jgi:hypothetical protein
MDIDSVREMLRQNRVKFSNEAKQRMQQRNVTLAQIEQALQTGQIIEERRSKPYPKCTVRGYVNREVAGLTLPFPQPLNVACALGYELHIITVYWD